MSCAASVTPAFSLITAGVRLLTAVHQEAMDAMPTWMWVCGPGNARCTEAQGGGYSLAAVTCDCGLGPGLL